MFFVCFFCSVNMSQPLIHNSFKLEIVSDDSIDGTFSNSSQSYKTFTPMNLLDDKDSVWTQSFNYASSTQTAQDAHDSQVLPDDHNSAFVQYPPEPIEEICYPNYQDVFLMSEVIVFVLALCTHLY